MVLRLARPDRRACPAACHERCRTIVKGVLGHQEVEVVHEAQRPIGPEPVDQADGALERHRDDTNGIQPCRDILELGAQGIVAQRRRLVHRGQIVSQLGGHRRRADAHARARAPVPG